MQTFSTAAQAARANKAWRALVTAVKAHEVARDLADPGERFGQYFGKAEFDHFDIRLHGEPISKPYDGGRVYWIESRQFWGSDGEPSPREYIIKARDAESGQIDTISEYPHYATAEEATAAMRFIVLGVSE